MHTMYVFIKKNTVCHEEHTHKLTDVTDIGEKLIQKRTARNRTALNEKLVTD